MARTGTASEPDPRGRGRHKQFRCWLMLSALLGMALPGPSAIAQNRPPLRIGILNDRSGPYSDASGQGSVVMAQLAIEDFHRDSPGTSVEVVAADHQNKSDVGSAIARQWVDVDHVSAIFDVPNAGVALAVQEVVRTRGGLLFTSGGGAPVFSGKSCSPYGFQWTFDTTSLANVAGRALAANGNKTWFLMQLDSAFGEAMSSDLQRVVSASGGTIVGSVKTALNTSDFSSALLQAQASKAQLVALLNAGTDSINSVKQANEFGLPQGGQRLYAVIMNEAEVRSLGQATAQGLTTTSPFYWAQSPQAEAVSRRYLQQMSRPPTWDQIGVYSSVLAYLRAAKAAGSADRDAVAAEVHATPVNDAYVADGTVRATGRMLHEMLLTEVKSPGEMKQGNGGEWDVFKIVSRVPGADAAGPVDPACSLVH